MFHLVIEDVESHYKTTSASKTLRDNFFLPENKQK